ncbi:MAG: glycosyltransferase [Proteobacteria bacterium]|nr:glycosyltransferase [Pseudomonadota bacterium]
MRCPTLTKIPPPPPGKTGWPWTEESIQLSNKMPDGSSWPKISIVTPSLNQGQFIEETIRSVLLQGYPNIEYIVIDGGSTDESLAIIKKYDKWLTYWVSEPDSGQSAAINKGVRKTNGDIAAWINSDDSYCIGTFNKIAQIMWRNGQCDKGLVIGNAFVTDAYGNIISHQIGTKFDYNNIITFWKGPWIPQPSVFILGDIFRNNLLDESLHYSMDWDLWVRLSIAYDFHYYSDFFANYRYHEASKTIISKEPFWDESNRQFKKHRLKGVKGFMLLVGLNKWRIKRFYHSLVREYLKYLLLKSFGKGIFDKIKKTKLRYFPSLSKNKL